MAIPSPLYYACFPLQEYFVDKDTGFPLAAGQVFFYEDTNRSVLKNVYQQEQQPNGEYQFALLPNPLTLSSVGTFQDNSGNDIIPFLYPFTGLPAAPTGILDLYFIEVYNSQGVLQFTREAWPPNSYGTSPASSQSELSQNILTNTQFSSISYVPDPTTGSLTFNASPAATSVEFAPGWEIVTTGTGTVVITQIPINASIISEAPYAIQIASAGAGLTSVQLRQRIPESPRILYGDYVSGLFLISNQNLASVAVQMSYVPSTGAQYVIAQGVTANDASFSPILGVNDLSVILNGAVNTDAPPAGYVDIYIDFPVLSTVQITSTQIVQVQNAETFANFVQLSVPQQTNSTFYWSKPRLEYKPIPSYSLGWDFAMNPFQAQGTAAVLYNPSSLGKSVYVADQTILFQSTVNSYSISKPANRYIQLDNLNQLSSCALIQYLGPCEAQELLTNPVCSQISGVISAGLLNGQINLYYTTDAALPVLSGDSTIGGYSLVSAVDAITGTPTVGGGGLYGNWTKINFTNESVPTFELDVAVSSTSLSNWNAAGQANIDNATFFAIVVSFPEYNVGSTFAINYVSLQNGYIPTSPGALSFGETLNALQQYYEKSYDTEILPGATAGRGVYSSTSNIFAAGGVTYSYASDFSIKYRVSKRADATVTFYHPNGTINTIFAVIVLGGLPVALAPATFTPNDWSRVEGQNTAHFTPAVNASVQFAAVNNNSSASIQFQYVADARFGIV
jgi:hypothetical protein